MFYSFDRSKAVVFVLFLLNNFGVGVSCRILYSFVVDLYVNHYLFWGRES